jgi:hypothetical protein
MHPNATKLEEEENSKKVKSEISCEKVMKFSFPNSRDESLKNAGTVQTEK